ncbi:MAG: U32 family peptidase [Defluviitaleaceae bacterium]|nr:U32 family peptidase [Defluviitaleaceae bacterium]
MKKPELLAPAGDYEKLQMAIAYGADAVYVGGKQFSLRANAKNFDTDELRKAIAYAHSKDVKVYVSVNIFANNHDFTGLEEYLQQLKQIGADAVIVADLGVLAVARQIPGLEIHISTQANITNYQSAELYKNLGASRVILARELSLGEIREITIKTATSKSTASKMLPGTSSFETEVFVHGAMCMSYSGRCLLSNYMANRDANKGDCAQPCRWNYYLTEELRPGEHIPIYEDDRGTYIMNSKDLCMVKHIPELVATGVSSLKIEGRMKTAYYVAAVTRIYRHAIDDYFTCESLYKSKLDYYMHEINKTGNRDFYTGFYFGRPHDGQNMTNTIYNNTQDFLGVAVDYDANTKQALIQQRNKFAVGEEVEFLKSGQKQTITEIYNQDGTPLTTAPHPKQMLRIPVTHPVEKLEIMRRS